MVRTVTRLNTKPVCCRSTSWVGATPLPKDVKRRSNNTKNAKNVIKRDKNIKRWKTWFMLLTQLHEATPNSLSTWDLRDVNYSSVAVVVLQKMNADGAIQPNCKVCRRKFYIIYDYRAKEEVILICCFIICVCHFPNVFLKWERKKR